MDKKRFFSTVLIFCFVLISTLNLILIIETKNFNFVTGNAAISGSVHLIISRILIVNIIHPLEQNYDFFLSDGTIFDGHYYFPVEVNVTTNDEPFGWKYTVFNNGELVVDEQSFTPNNSLNFRVGTNQLIVYAKSEEGEWFNDEVTFEVRLAGAVPIIEAEENIYTCEGDSLISFFNVTDYSLTLNKGGSVSIEPTNFFSTRILGLFEPYKYRNEIFSYYLGEETRGVYEETLAACNYLAGFNPPSYCDEFETIIHILDVNMEPQPLENLGVFKIWTVGEGTEFNEVYEVFDEEDGISRDGNLSFNLSYDNGNEFILFDINEFGYMYYNASGEENQQFNLKICVTDRGIEDPDPNSLTYCDNDGNNNTVCDSFYLTFSDENRAPQIVEYYNTNLTLVEYGQEQIDFNITAHDSDGDVLDVRWFVDDIEVSQENLFDVMIDDEDAQIDYNYESYFNYTFPCDIFGFHNISAFVSDGLLNVSVVWNISLLGVSCPVEERVSSSGGGGGGGLGACYEKWGCEDWDVCQSVEGAFNLGVLTLEDYNSYIDLCNQIGFSNCGYHFRNCYDVFNCTNLVPFNPKPEEIEVCEFVLNPGCRDGIKNCHSGGCELAIDCGGPCPKCPTCSDGIMNQGETGIDCGGPCPFACDPEMPKNYNWLFVLLSVILVVIIVFISYRLILLFKKRRKERGDKRERSIESLLSRNNEE